MKTIPAALLQQLQAEEATLATCWVIEKRDGTFVRGTEHDSDIPIPPAGDSPEDVIVGYYYAGANITASDSRATADSAVDNMEVTGAIPDGSQVQPDITVNDIEAGLLDSAPVTVFLVNWRAPQDGVHILQYGYLGDIPRDSDGMYKTEVRGLKQLLAQSIVRTYSERCQVHRFGDAECKYPLENVTVSGTVTAVTNARRFLASIDADSPPALPGAYNGGEFSFTSGLNTGYTREVKRDDNGNVHGDLSFWERFPADPQVGDTFMVSRGCPRTLSACIAYGNVVNFRGYGVLIEGMDALMRGPL